MKIVGILGILAFLLGGLIFLVGLIVCITTYNSDYASSTCEQAARDREKFGEAKTLCGSVTSDCYKQATIGLTSQADCDYKTEYMQKQLLMGIVPVVIGGIVAFVGLLMGVGGFFFARRKKPAVAS